MEHRVLSSITITCNDEEVFCGPDKMPPTVAANDMACSPSDPPRPGERERPSLPGTVQRLVIRACVYASELSFYLISAAAATLSRRLARATFYSLLPSRSGCAPLPPFPRVSERVHAHFVSFTSFALRCLPSPAPFSSHSLLSFFSLGLYSSSFHSISLSFLFLPFVISFFSSPSPVSFSPQRLSLCPSFYRSFPRTPRLSTRTCGPLVVSVLFSRSPQM